MQVVDRQPEEMDRLFIEAYERLSRSCGLYDAGHISEAPDMAKEVANFVYDHGNSSISILSAMRLKASADFCDTAEATRTPPNGGVLLSNEYKLMDAQLRFDGMHYEPFLGRNAPYRYLSFDTWWSGVVLTRYEPNLPGGRETISRQELVIYLRHKEGGAHVAPRHFLSAKSIDKMRRLMEGEYVDGYMVLNESTPITAEDHIPAYATMRQIGFEALASLKSIRPDLVSRAQFKPVPGPRMKPGTR